MNNEVTYLGKVINVDSNSIEVEINGDEIQSYAPVINGRLYRIGQIGTLVKIPVGYLNLYGIVSSVSNTPSKIENKRYDGIAVGEGTKVDFLIVVDLKRRENSYLKLIENYKADLQRNNFGIPVKELFQKIYRLYSAGYFSKESEHRIMVYRIGYTYSVTA